MAQLRDVDAFVLGVILAFVVVGLCLTPYRVGDIVALFKRPPNDEVGGQK